MTTTLQSKQSCFACSGLVLQAVLYNAVTSCGAIAVVVYMVALCSADEAATTSFAEDGVITMSTALLSKYAGSL
jgi:hypothetical protein